MYRDAWDEQDEREFFEEAQRIDLQYHWKCPHPGCDYEYEDEAGFNEDCKCPDHQIRCIKSGESYRASPPNRRSEK